MRKLTTKKMVILSLLLAVGVVFNYAENVLIGFSVMPGIKLGLANTIGLITLALFGPIEFIAVGFLRVLLTSLFSGFGLSSLIAVAGWGLSTIVVLLLYLTKKLSLFGLSAVSAVAHGLGQVIIVSLVYQTYGMFVYFPILALTGLVSGILIALLARLVLLRIPRLEADYE